MAQTANEEIRDKLIVHQTELLRAAAGVGREMTQLLNAVDRDLRGLIERRMDVLTSDLPRFGKVRTRRLLKLQEGIRELQRPVWKQVRGELRSNILELAQMEVAFAANTITSALPVTVALDLPNTQNLRRIVTSQPFEGKILSRWVTELEAADRARMMGQIRIGLVQGESSVQIGRRVFGTSTQRFNDGVRRTTRRNIQSIVNTAVSFISNESRQELYVANKAIIPIEIYVATLDARTTDICASLDGKRFEVGKGPTPPVHFNCRSLRTPAVRGRLLGTRPANATTKKMLEGLKGDERRRVVDGLVGQVPASETYQVFLKKQTAAFQNDRLGVTKGKLFRKGKLTVDNFVNDAGKSLTLPELRRLNPQAFKLAGID